VVEDPGGSISYRAPVYVGVGSSNSGDIFASAAANRVRLDPARAWFEQQADGRCVIALNYV
jgi:hypothetical protein